MDLLQKPETETVEPTSSIRSRSHRVRKLLKKIGSATGILVTLIIIAFILTIILYVIVFVIGPTSSNVQTIRGSPGEKGEEGDQGPEGPEGPQNNAQNPPLEEWQNGICVINVTNKSKFTYNFKFIQPFLSGIPIITGSLCCENPSENLTYSIHSVTDKGFSITIANAEKFIPPLNFQFFAFLVKETLNRQHFWEKELFRATRQDLILE